MNRIVEEGPMLSLDFSPPPADRTCLVKVEPTPIEYPRLFEISESDLAPEDGPMVYIPFNPPLPADATTRVVPIREAPKLRPIFITESDLAPE